MADDEPTPDTSPPEESAPAPPAEPAEPPTPVREDSPFPKPDVDSLPLGDNQPDVVALSEDE
jgi:hypothetical protein